MKQKKKKGPDRKPPKQTWQEKRQKNMAASDAVMRKMKEISRGQRS